MAYDSTTTYITKENYFQFSGIDLLLELKAGYSDNPSKRADIFLKNVQTYMYQYMVNRFNIEDWELNWDDDTFKEALLWQTKHTLDNGEETGLSETAYYILRQHGMANPKWS